MPRPGHSTQSSNASTSPAEKLPVQVGPQMVSAEDEARAFWRMRIRQVRTVVIQTFVGARFRLLLIVLLSAMLWAALFALFAEGFEFLKDSIPSPDLHEETVRAVFGMFFVALFTMLVFSAGIILYSSLFRAPDIPLLFSLPARVERIFLHKLQEAILLASWAFILLGSPMLLAYGIVASAPWHYFVLMVPFLVSFTFVPSGIGAILCLLIVYRIPSGRFVAISVSVVLATLAVAAIAWSMAVYPSSDLLTPRWFQQMLTRLEFAQHRLLPSWWLSSGLLESATGELAESTLFLALLISNALFLRHVAVWTAGRVYRAAYDRLRGKRSARRRRCGELMDAIALRVTRLLPAQMRYIIVKDLRLFRRDPVQWSQFLIFFGLLALYFINIRRFQYDRYYVGWVNVVSFLNVSVVGLLLSTFTTRFIFPMISLESRRFWVLGLLPLKRERILWSKFFFAAGGSIVPCGGLILLSDVMLRVKPVVLASHQLTCVILCFGLSGIAVGMGARMPSLREESPSKIAAGFGGTLNLVTSTLYIIAVVLLTAVPCHFFVGARGGYLIQMFGGSLGWWLRFWLVAGTAGSVVLGLLATVIPLRIGFRAFRQLEF